MRKSKKFLFGLVLFLLALFPVFSEQSQLYSITQEQKETLENNLKMQKSIIAQLKTELITQSILLADLSKQLEQCKAELNISNQALNQAKKSLTQLEIKKLKINIIIGGSCLAAGFVIGGFVGYRVAHPP